MTQDESENGQATGKSAIDMVFKALANGIEEAGDIVNWIDDEYDTRLTLDEVLVCRATLNRETTARPVLRTPLLKQKRARTTKEPAASVPVATEEETCLAGLVALVQTHGLATVESLVRSIRYIRDLEV